MSILQDSIRYLVHSPKFFLYLWGMERQKTGKNWRQILIGGARSNVKLMGKLSWVFSTGLLLCACTATDFAPIGSSGGGAIFERSSTSLSSRQPDVRSSGGLAKVALLLPKTGSPEAVAIGRTFQNTAAMAMQEIGQNQIQMLAFDTGGTIQGGQLAADQAIRQGVVAIVGPIFAPAVGGAGTVARSAGIPVLAFSTDRAVAAPGIYLTGFLPSNDVARIVRYAHGQGIRSFAVLVPDNAYGAVVEAAFRQNVGGLGGRVDFIERYRIMEDQYLSNDDPQSAEIDAAYKMLARRVAPQLGRIDALFIPEGGAVPGKIARHLQQAGADLSSVRLLGSGRWQALSRVDRDLLAGSWYPAPAAGRFEEFAARYSARYGARPPRNSSIAYDATSLVIGLNRVAGQGGRLNRSLLTNPSGFRGMDGIFRLLPNGLNLRELAIWQVEKARDQRLASPDPNFAAAARGSATSSPSEREAAESNPAVR